MKGFDRRSVDKDRLNLGVQLKRMPRAQDNIRIFPRGQRPNSVSDTAQLCCRQSDGLQGSLWVHSLLSGQSGAQEQVLNGQLRVISTDGHRHTSFHQSGGIGHPLVCQLRLGAVTDDGPHHGTGALSGENIRHQIPFRGVD